MNSGSGNGSEESEMISIVRIIAIVVGILIVIAFVVGLYFCSFGACWRSEDQTPEGEEDDSEGTSRYRPSDAEHNAVVGVPVVDLTDFVPISRSAWNVQADDVAPADVENIVELQSLPGAMESSS